MHTGNVRERRVDEPSQRVSDAGSPTTVDTPTSDGDEILPVSMVSRDGQRWCWASACAWPLRTLAPKRVWKRLARSPRGAFGLCLLVLCFFALVLASGSSGGKHHDPLTFGLDRQQHALDDELVEAHPGAFVTRYTRWRAYFVALNLYNNEELLPEFTVRMEDTLRRVLVPSAGGDPKAVFVSVMSNGNTDATGSLIDGPFTAMLRRVGVSFEVRSNASACARWRLDGPNEDLGDETDADAGEAVAGDRSHDSDIHGHGAGAAAGYRKRPPAMGRTEWMACLRNSAMRPLYRHGTSGLFREAKGAAAIGPDQTAVLFFNDIYFRARDIADLLATNAGKFDLACGLDYYYSFYDTWGTRDIDGARFDPQPPFATHPTTQRLLAQKHEAPVKCCWNGVAAIAADVFVPEDSHGRVMPRRHPPAALPTTGAATQQQKPPSQQPLRFRANRTDEKCYASECQHICADMMESGRDRIFVNPRVRVAYEPYFDRLQHGGVWWYSPALVEGLLRWVRVWSWPLFYAPPPAASLTTAGLQCVTVAETYTISQATVASWICILGIIGCIVCNCTVARRHLEKLNTTHLPVVAANAQQL